jgi:hypothetical protein
VERGARAGMGKCLYGSETDQSNTCEVPSLQHHGLQQHINTDTETEPATDCIHKQHINTQDISFISVYNTKEDTNSV